MIKSAEEGVLMLFGENMAISLVLKAILVTHPNPGALHAVLTELQAKAAAALTEKPAPNLQTFRYEQVLENLLAGVPKAQ